MNITGKLESDSHGRHSGKKKTRGLNKNNKKALRTPPNSFFKEGQNRSGHDESNVSGGGASLRGRKILYDQVVWLSLLDQLTLATRGKTNRNAPERTYPQFSASPRRHRNSTAMSRRNYQRLLPYLVSAATLGGRSMSPRSSAPTPTDTLVVGSTGALCFPRCPA